MILSATLVVSSSSPSRISLPIINDKVAVLLHGKIVWFGSLGLSLAGPSGCFVGIIDDQISVLLHSDVHRGNTFIVCLWSPFSVGRYPIFGFIDAKISIILQDSIEVISWGKVVSAIKGLIVVKGLSKISHLQNIFI